MNILAVCDPGGEYGKRLGEYARTRAGYPLELQSFSTIEQLQEYRKKREPEAVLLDSGLYEAKEWQDYENPLFLLGSGFSGAEDPPSVFRYQEADSVLGEILALYRQKRPRLNMKVEKRQFRLYAVTDAVESRRSEKLAFDLAAQLAETEKVLWLDLRTYSGLQEIYGCGAGGDLGKILYSVCRKKADLTEQILEAVISCCRVDLLPAATEPADLMSITVENWKYLFERVQSESPYTAMVVVTGNLVQPLGLFLELFDVIWMVWEEKEMICQQRLERYVKNTACPQLWKKIRGIQLPEESSRPKTDKMMLHQMAVKILQEEKESNGRSYQT